MAVPIWSARPNVSRTRERQNVVLPEVGLPVERGTATALEASSQGRKSHGIQSFFEHIPDLKGQHILDLGTLVASTPNFLSKLGHHVHYVSLLQSWDAVRSKVSRQGGEIDAETAGRFVKSYLDYPPNSFQAVLAWDVLQHLDVPVMQQTIAHLAKIIRPLGPMLCLFHERSRDRSIPLCKCAVCSETTISVRELSRRPTQREFNARTLEQLFPHSRAVHFYLKRNAVLEVLVLH